MYLLRKQSAYNAGAAVILLLVLLACLLMHSRGHNWGDDFSLYLHQAEAIRTGSMQDIYHQNGYILQASSRHDFSPVTYPWGFPLILSPLLSVFGLNYEVFKIMESVFLLAGLLMFYLLLRGRMEAQTRLLTLAVTAFMVALPDYTNNILSEFPYMLCCMLTLWTIERVYGMPRENAGCYTGPAITGFLLYGCFMIRTEGAILGFALACYQAYHYKTWSGGKILRSRILFRVFLPYLVVVTLYLAIGQLLPSGFVSHLSAQKMGSLAVIRMNTVFYAECLVRFLFLNLPYIPAAIPLILVCLTGAWNRRKNDTLLITFVLGSAVVFLIWPFREGRYILILLPFMIYFFVQGLQFIFSLSRIKTPLLFYLLTAWALLNMNDSIGKTVYIQRHPQVEEGPGMKASRELFTYIKSHTSPRDTIIFFRPRLMHFYTNRLSLMIDDNPYHLLEKGNYWVLHKRMAGFCQLDPSIVNHPLLAAFTKEFENEAFIMFRINRS